MKKIILFSCSIIFSIIAQAQVYKTINVSTAGQLRNLLTANEKSTITNLTVTGVINVNDITTMTNYYMPNLSVIDISATNIVAGTQGFYSYENDEFPFYAFRYDSVLVSIKLPNSVLHIGDQAFQGCSRLESIDIPPLDTIIRGYCFQSCTSLKTVNIPASVKTIALSAFSMTNCDINVDPNNINYSSVNGVLFNKAKTTLYTFPASITGDYVIPSTVKNVISGSFYKCNNLTSITIPTSVANSLDYVFVECSANFIVETGSANFSSLDGILYDKYKTKLVAVPTTKTGDYIIPNTVSTINEDVFNNCNALASIFIPASVDDISWGTFMGCSAEITVDAANADYSSIDGSLYNKTQTQLLACPSSKTGRFIIPVTVGYIDDYAFSKGTNLTSIYILKPTLIDLSYNTNDPFKYIDKSNVTLYVPQGMQATYESQYRWNGFTTILEHPGFIVSETTVSIPQTAGTTTVDIEAFDTWGVSSSDDWISYSPMSGIDGNSTITITTTENTSATSRTGTITITTLQGTKDLIITQAGVEIISSLQDNSLNEITIKPNSTNSNFTITNVKNGRIEMYNVNGTLIKKSKIDENEIINMQGLSQGVYYVKIFSEGKIIVKELVVK